MNRQAHDAMMKQAALATLPLKVAEEVRTSVE